MMYNIAFQIADIGRLFRRNFNGDAKDIGITGPQWRVLFNLERTPGINQGQLSERLEVEPITTCRMIDRLEQAGLVERRRDPLDRRAWQIYLSDAAQPLIGQLHHIADDMTAKALHGLSEDEKAQLTGLLDRMRSNLLAFAPSDSSAADSKEAIHG
jgi:DNA-binding MarR family transcriptional regulator